MYDWYKFCLAQGMSIEEMEKILDEIDVRDKNKGKVNERSTEVGES